MAANLKVWVNGNDSDMVRLFARWPGYMTALNIKEADIVVFLGGADVSPHLYGEERMSKTVCSIARDKFDITAFRESGTKIKIGICRGGQFLNVMNGGKLWQDVDMHCRSHILEDQFTHEKVYVSSTHHQQFRPAKGAVVIATARETTRKDAAEQHWHWKKDGSAVDNFFQIDYEVLYYPDTQSLCFQPHPEYLSPPGTEKYFHSVLKRMLAGEFDKK